MSIKTPGKHFTSTSAVHAIIKWRRQRRSRKSVMASLMLTPMIDVFAVLTLFLLANFSATGEVLFMQKDIKLPEAIRASAIERAPVVTVSKKKIALEGDYVGESFTQNIDKLTAENWEINRLTDMLEDIRRRYYDDKGLEFPGKINIQADKELPFLLIKRVMFTCTQAGYYNINFAVNKGMEKKKSKL